MSPSDRWNRPSTAEQRKRDPRGTGHVVNPHPLLTAGDVMTSSVVTFRPHHELEEVIRTLLSERITGAPVVDERNRLLGMIGENACLRLLATSTYEDVPLDGGHVRDHMTRDVITVTEEDDLHRVADLFLHRGCRRLPVVDEEARVVGIITRSNVLRGLERILDAPSRPSAKYPDYSKPDPDMTG